MQALHTPAFPAARSRAASVAWPLRAIAAGAVYAAAALLVGVVLAVPRELYLAPRITTELAIVLETPLMIWISFLLAGAAARIFAVPTASAARLLMAAAGLTVLLWGENEAAIAWRDRTLIEQWGLYGYLALAASIAGVAGFTLAPLLTRRPRA